MFEIEQEGAALEQADKTQRDALIELSIGALTLSLEELISLRPGSEIKVEKPKVLGGVLTIDSHPWAYVDIVLTDASLEVKVKEFAVLPGVENA